MSEIDYLSDEYQYLELLEYVNQYGEVRQDRTGVGTVGVFGERMVFDLTQGFPLLTTKRMSLKGIVGELIWFISGNTNTKFLTDNGITIWDDWSDENGELGPVYGTQWRSWPFYNPLSKNNLLYIDQLANVVESIKSDPTSRRHIVSAWNVAELDQMALPPCHLLFQFYVRQGKYLDCQLYQRSADLFLGVPYNIASYSLLTHMIAQVTGLTAGMFYHTLGDAHIYTNHLEQVKLQLTRKPYRLPSLVLNPDVKNIDDFTIEDVSVENYHYYPSIKGDVAV